MAASDTVKNILCLGTEINEILETLIVRGQKSGEVRKEVVPVLTVYVLSTSIDYGFRQIINSILEVRI